MLALLHTTCCGAATQVAASWLSGSSQDHFAVAWLFAQSAEERTAWHGRLCSGCPNQPGQNTSKTIPLFGLVAFRLTGQPFMFEWTSVPSMSAER
jgi:hypothetical protein